MAQGHELHCTQLLVVAALPLAVDEGVVVVV